MKKDNYLNSKADEFFDSVKNLNPTDLPADLARKIQYRIDNSSQETLVKPISFLRYAAAVSLLILNLSAIYQLTSKDSSIAKNEIQELFEMEYELNSQSLFR